MKTPIQELIDEMTYMLTEGESNIYALREKAKSLLEKEKEVMCEFAEEYVGSCLIDYPKIKIIFDQTFNN
jgi:hypothetical protein